MMGHGEVPPHTFAEKSAQKMQTESSIEANSESDELHTEGERNG